MKKPFVTVQQLEDIAARYPTPFHLYDEQGIRENARRLKAAFSWNPGYREYFAVKATPTPAILKILQEEGCGCDCSSLTELMMAGRIGCAGEHIMFSSNETPAEDYRLAAKLGATINLDDITHVDFLEKTIGYIPKRIGCRFNPGGTFSLGESREGFQVMDNPGDAKYGMTRGRSLRRSACSRPRVRRSSASTHFWHPIRSPTLTIPRWRASFPARGGAAAGDRLPYHLYQSLRRRGYPVPAGGAGNDIAVIGEGVRKVYEEILVPAGMGDVALYTELGRFMLAPYGHLVTRTIHEKHIYKEYIGTDACACDLMRPAIYGSYHHITVMGKEDAPCDHKYDIVGGLCENNDKFAVDRMLPRIDIGDLLVIHDAGAHGLAMGYNYNGKLPLRGGAAADGRFHALDPPCRNAGRLFCHHDLGRLNEIKNPGTTVPGFFSCMLRSHHRTQSRVISPSVCTPHMAIVSRSSLPIFSM